MDNIGEKTTRQMERLACALRDFRQLAVKLDEVYDNRSILNYSPYDGQLTLETHLQSLIDGLGARRATIIEILNESTGGEEAAARLLERARA